MRLSTVFELLLIFLFIAFAASRSVDKHHHHHHHHKHGGISKSRQAPAITKPATAPNRYCQCTSVMCNCCRDFSLPVVSLKGPGCANVQYLTGDSMRLTMSFGDRILRNITLSGKKPRPVCMGLPGAETKFCGRIYGIQRTGDQFKACLALEMRSLDEIEAALRVSCFKFGPDGVKLEPGRPVPDTDDYDDDDDDYGFDDEDDDDDDDFLADDDDEDEENDVDSGDYTGFSALGDEFLDGFFGSGPTKKKKKNGTTPSPVKATKKPISPSTTQKNDEKMNTTTVIPNIQENSTPGKTGGNISNTEQMSDSPTTPTILTSTMVSVKVMQDGNTLEDSSSTNSLADTTSENSQKIMIPSSTPGTTTIEVSSTTHATNGIDSKQDIGDDEEDEDEEQEQEDDDADEEEEGSTSGITENPIEKETVVLQSKDDDERNILDGILGEDEEEENEKVEEDDDDGDEEEEEDEFRQLRSHVPRGPYQPMTIEDQERQFPGLSALIKPPSVPFMSLQEQERRFPGLAALIRPPIAPQQPDIAFDFPPVRSARTHRRMRLPPA